MGLLSFLNKKPKREGFEFPSKEELDIPPAPPSISEETELPSFPSREAVAEKPAPTGVKELEQEAVSVVKEGLEERETLEATKPIFIKYGMYKAMLDKIGEIKAIVKESEGTLFRLGDFKEDEDKEFNKWHRQLEDIQRKMIYADKTLFKK